MDEEFLFMFFCNLAWLQMSNHKYVLEFAINKLHKKEVSGDSFYGKQLVYNLRLQIRIHK